MDLKCLNVLIINIVCVTARSGGHGGGGHGGGGHGGHGGHGGYHGGSHGSVHSYGGSHIGTHYTYSYHPPSHISYTCRYCTHTSTYPVFHGQPPAYVYTYRESSGRFGDLLTGLALYNLGRSSAQHDSHSRYHSNVPDEKCSLQVIDQSHFEETTIDCMIMSSFLSRAQDMKVYNSSSKKVDITSSDTPVRPPVDNGDPLQITTQQCMLWHNRTMVKERKDVPCALLKQYAETMKPSGVPVYIWFPTLIGIVITIALCCQCFNKNKKYKEEAPLNQDHVIGYCSNVPIH